MQLGTLGKSGHAFNFPRSSLMPGITGTLTSTEFPCCARASRFNLVVYNAGYIAVCQETFCPFAALASLPSRIQARIGQGNHVVYWFPVSHGRIYAGGIRQLVSLPQPVKNCESALKQADTRRILS